MSALLVGFESQEAMHRAVERLAAADMSVLETYSPMPAEGEGEREGGGSPIPLAMFIAGMLGFLGFFLLMTYADVRAYPLDIGGRPKFAWPAFVPIAFELGVLCAMAIGFFGYFVACRLPRLYAAVDECESFRRASRDAWFLTLRCEDPKALGRARAILDPLQPMSIEEFSE